MFHYLRRKVRPKQIHRQAMNAPTPTPKSTLIRFVDAQAPVIEQVLRELKAGQKTTHWMWFVFPQIHGLGNSPMAQRYAIASMDEARAYLADPVLGPRLRQCVSLLLETQGKTARQILGTPDDLKLRSSLTLFRRAAEDDAVFAAALERFFEGEEDPATVARL